MKTEEIKNIPAGVETDKLILKEVYGLEVKEGDTIPEFSTKTADAMLLAEFLAGDEQWSELSFQLSKPQALIKLWVASFNNKEFIASGETLALAISRATLLAVMELE